MRILFINYTYPGIFGPLLTTLHDSNKHDIFFMSSYRRLNYSLPNVHQIRLSSNYGKSKPNQELEHLIAAGKQALSSFEQLRKAGCTPDIVLATFHGGYAYFWERAFPNAFKVCWSEEVPISLSSMQASDPALVRSFVQCKQALSSDLFVSLTAGNRSFLGKSLARAVDLPYAVNAEWFAPEKAEIGYDTEFYKGLNINDGDEMVLFSVNREETGSTPARVRLLLQRRKRVHVILMCDCTATMQRMQLELGDLIESSKRVNVLGVISLGNYRSLLSRSSLVVFTGLFHIAPSSLLETMSCATPPVLLPGCVPSPYLKDRYNVFLVDEPRDSEFVDKLVALLDDAELVSRVGQAARKTILDNFDYRKLTPRQADFLIRRYGVWKKLREAEQMAVRKSR